MPQYQYGQHKIEYGIRRSQRRTLSITVDPAEGVLARAPLNMPQAQIEAFIAAKAGWILRHLLAQQAQREANPRAALSEGALLPYRGQSYELHLEPQRGLRRQQPELVAGRLVLHTNETSEAALREILQRWYRREAMRLLRPRIHYYADMLGLPMPPLFIRTQARRWGSCSSAGEIRLNWRLILLDDELSDYVCAHEACHLKVMNHSPRFWRLLGTVFPEWKAARLKLRERGASLSF